MSKPAAASICAEFLAQDMQHIHRQITGLRTFEPFVITWKRSHEDHFPFERKRIVVLPKPKTRALRRAWQRTIQRRPVEIYPGEVHRLLYEALRVDAAVVHIYFGHVAMNLVPFIQACPRPVVISFHGADVGVDMDRPAYRARLLEALARADLVIARSEALLNDLVALGCPRARVRLHRTGIPLDRWPMWERKIPPRDGRWKLLQACRLIEKKGIDTTIAAFERIAREEPGATLTIAGDGPLRGALARLARARGVADRVKFTGFLDQGELRNLVYESHVFLHPSRTGRDGNREGVPNSMLEAMASGLPVVATRHGGIPEAIDDGTSGFLVEESDAEELAEATLRLMESESLFRRTALAGRETVAERFERRAQTAALEAHYHEAIALRAARSIRRSLASTPASAGL